MCEAGECLRLGSVCTDRSGVDAVMASRVQ